MDRRAIILWSLSAMLLVWLAASTWHTHRIEACIAEGGRWISAKWECDRDAGRIILDRGLKRS